MMCLLKSPHSFSAKAMTSVLRNNDIEAIVLSKNKKEPMDGGKDDPDKGPRGETRELTQSQKSLVRATEEHTDRKQLPVAQGPW